MMPILLKFVHVGAIALWAAGLFALPFVYRQRAGLEGPALYRIHSFTRTLYIGFVSPAAFVAIGSGTALIFAEATFVPWFSAKLFFVAVMVVLHILSGLVILRLFEPEGVYPAWRFPFAVGATSAAIGAILVLVLGKPDLAMPEGLAGLFEPGALSEMLGGYLDAVIAWTR